MPKTLLHVLKASAGSGKTYSLVKTYLKLVLLSEDNRAFARIMAMTFTNKATLEMKERVMENLLALSSPKDSEKSSQLLLDYAKDFGMKPEEIQKKAQQLLRTILHNYGSLSIMTLDKFNIRLVRSFTKDLDLPMDFNINLDTKERNELLYDQLTNAIGKKGEEKLTDLLLQFATNKSEDEKSWNFKEDLLVFMNILGKEELLPILEEIEQRTYDNEKLSAIHARLNSIEKEYEKQRDDLIQELQSKGWQKEDFSVGLTSIHGRLEKIKTQNFIDVEDLSSPMYESLHKERNNPRTKISLEYVSKIENFYTSLGKVRNEYTVLYNVKNSFHLLALLKRIKLEAVVAQNKENAIQIEDFNRLISGIIQSESAPYIYERIGSRYDHYMLDEFQDTSHLQWRNMLPLVHESLSSAKENLIVGDAKQAIYRFRNGIVEQFEALPEVYNPENEPKIASFSTYFSTVGQTDSLKNNFRSRDEIVTFNNNLFAQIRTFLNPNYQKFYSDETLIQQPQKGKGGLVSISCSDDEEAFTIKAIQACLEDGFLPSDICILTRNNTACADWGRFLVEKDYKVISSEGLQVQNSIAVRCFICYAQYREQLGNINRQIRFMESFYRLKHDTESIHKIACFSEQLPKNPIAEFAKTEFKSLFNLNFSYENLYDLGQKWVRLMQLNELCDPYLHHLCSMLHAFDVKKGADIHQFLDFYNRTGKSMSISLPETPDAINLSTVHKSKGLEFPVVIIPSLKWDYALKSWSKRLFFDTQHDEIYIAGPATEPGLGKTDYQIMKNKEDTEANKLDEVNLLYVALTRAKERLYIAYSAKPKSKSIESFFSDVLNKINITKLQDGGSLTIGERTKYQNKTSQQESVAAKNIPDTLWFPNISLIDNYSLSKEHLHKEQRFGIQFHAYLANISSLEDAGKTLFKMLQRNEIDDGFSEKMLNSIQQIQKQEAICALIFPSEDEHILNESDILLETGERIRPDRIITKGNTARIIDFKTGVAREKDENQVKNYMSVLKSMNYEKVDGYLLYTDTQTLVKLG